MADISLFFTNVNVSVGRDGDGRPAPKPAKEFECVELGELDKSEEQQREKVPRRIIHFSSGETMEEYSTDEEEAEDKEPERKDLLASQSDASRMTWGPYFGFHIWRAATSTISACDYLGERMASLFGITSAKYQYAIDEYYRIKKEREEEKDESRLSEEAERSFDHPQPQEEDDEPISAMEEREVVPASSSLPDSAYRVENEAQATSNTIRVPAIVTAT